MTFCLITGHDCLGAHIHRLLIYPCHCVLCSEQYSIMNKDHLQNENNIAKTYWTSRRRMEFLQVLKHVVVAAPPTATIEISVLTTEEINGCKFVLFCSGNLSPENLQKYSMEALNTTQVYAAWTYDWVRQKVQTLSKIQ